MNIDITPRSVTVKLLVIFDFKRYELRHNPYIIELVPCFGISCAVKLKLAKMVKMKIYIFKKKQFFYIRNVMIIFKD